MKIGILQCDDVAPPLQERHGNYPDMFVRLLRRVDPDLQFQVWRCHDGQLPDLHTTTDIDAWLITGSKHAAYDDLPWIHQLGDLIRELYVSRQRLVGVCFGHQLMAHAMSGTVRRHPDGWGVGMSFNMLTTQQPWMVPWQDTLELIVSHQDQVSALPDNAVALGGSAFCPIYLMQLGDTFLGLQGHPEFTKAYSADLMEYRREALPDTVIETGLASLSKQTDSLLMAQWMLNFIMPNKTP